ncbi:sensor histidine kinase [Streptomyces indicus]|uniref:histidine kinase n=1 Tax=Streptomyces indicus TaxID=417292 RepID=A0A1G9B1Z4_9ACTN|nr:sensor histidine kinase [Streptomyces indicus]SDK33557.1 Signal transduction histidine kinase [Streptomyces indicus]
MAHSPPRLTTDRLSERGKDVAVVVAVALVVVGGTLWSMRDRSETPWQTALGWALIAVGCGALYFRRRWPVAVALFTLAVCAVYYPISVYDGPLLVVFVIALYTTAAEGRFATAVAFGIGVMLMIVYGEVHGRQSGRHVDDAQFMMLAGWLLSILVLARAQRTRAAYLEEVRARALAAEREQEARAQQSATEERLRIAREVHDVLGHSISLINVQSSAALHRLSKKQAGDDPAAALVSAQEALEAVKSTSKDALRELRSTLGMLRGAGEAAPTAPASGLAQLPELLDRARSAGLDVAAKTQGAPRPLPPPLDLAAYRIVQESLTNVTRHAQAASAAVTLDYGEDALRLSVEDDGVGAPDGIGEGSGIRGMAERARAFGGELATENTADGFRVTARLPYEAPGGGMNEAKGGAA